MPKEEVTSQSSDSAAKKETTGKNSQLLDKTDRTKVVGLSEGYVVEELMTRIQALMDQKPKQNKFQKLLTHPLLLLMATVLLSGFIGARVTHSYTIKQHELAADRAFSDELNKIRFQKLIELWERLDEHEGMIDRLLNQPDDPQAPDDKKLRAQEIEKLLHEDRRTVDRNRFWLGAQNYDRIHGYLDATSLYAIKKFLEPGGDLDPLLQQRKAAKSDFDSEREKSLKGNVEQSPRGGSCYLF